MKKTLVIVESPSKAKTINKYLGKDYIVEATIGHIKNLPRNKINIDIDNHYKPNYEIISGKEKVIEHLKDLASKAKDVIIATDPDREGEAIASDISQEIKNKNSNIKRVLFNEITKTGIDTAMNNPREIDNKLVSSQMARRVMDRILGYKLSPFLWKTFYFGLSAGRVQSVALKLICDREYDINNFLPSEYWSVYGFFSETESSKTKLHAKLYTIDGEIIKYNGDNPKLGNKEEVDIILAGLKTRKFNILDIQSREIKRNPPEPFTTSVLQQNASSRLGYSPKKTMLLAQKLYEGIEIKKGEGNIGLITYIRTDSSRISEEARVSASDFIRSEFGSNYLQKIPRKSKSSKSSQDAHEAIRPADVRIRPEHLKRVDSNLVALYELIWKRFVASQMSPAVFDQKTILIKSDDNHLHKNYVFKSTGREVKFNGFLKLYSDINDDQLNGNEEIEIIPEGIKIGDELNSEKFESEQHFTVPPPRYTESSLIKQLDTLGIGRPSTFASIVSTVIDRKYVILNEKKLFATELGLQVNKILQEHFTDVINTDFTANMEEELDTIASGVSDYKSVLDDFYKPFDLDLIKAESKAAVIKKSMIEKSDIQCPECGKNTGAVMLKKWGRNGLFYTCEKYPKCKATLSIDHDSSLNKQVEGVYCNKCGSTMVEKFGPYGKFYGCSRYPDCDGIKPLTLGIKCPKCKTGEILERKGGKRKRIFYGCTNYPECTFIENYLPVISKCKSCGNEYMLEKKSKKDGTYLQCPVCKHKEISDSL